MRVLMTLPWGQCLGGAEEQLQIILEGAHDTAHEIEPVFFEPGPWPVQLAHEGFRVRVVPAGRLRQVHRWAATVVRLARIMRERQPDLILNWSGKTQLYGSPAAMLAGMTDRVMWWNQSIPTPPSWLDRASTLLPAIAIGCNAQAAADAQGALFPHRRTLVWYAGTRMPDEPVAQAPLELPSGVPVVGLVGRLQPWKGQDRLLQAQALLRERGHDIHTVIVGGDAYGLSPEYAASLPPLISRLGLTDAVTMTGQVPDAGPYIEHMDIIVNASDPEPFGNVLVEGMARGVAAVGVNSGGPGEYLDDRRTGMLAASGDPSALADAIEPLLVSPDLRHAIADAGRELFMREFTEVAMRRRFFERLESVVAGAGNGASAGEQR